jgi:ketosteroid isomerase-like protein
MEHATEIVSRYWAAAGARDWAAFGALLAGDVVYELPQTRERIEGRADVVRFNEEYPGDWRLVGVRVIGEGRGAASWITLVAAGEEATGLSFFELTDDGVIGRITDFWPEPYEPPAGREHLVQRY